MKSLSDEELSGALRLGGWMLAQQALAAARGEIPQPFIAFARDDLSGPKLMAPRTDSDLYRDQVAAGGVMIKDLSAQALYWTFSYGADLADSGRALVLEVGAGEQSQGITFSQRYRLGEDASLSLIGDFEVVGREFLPPETWERLESLNWRQLLAQGAADHPLAGQQWSAWHSGRGEEQARLELDDFRFATPEGWFYRQMQDGGGWVLVRLLPRALQDLEPTIIAQMLVYPDPVTLEDLLEKRRSERSGRGDEVVQSEITRLPASSYTTRAAYLTYNGEAEGRRYRSTWVWVPGDQPGQFLLVTAVCFHEESWEGVTHALDSVLRSLGRTR